MGLEGVDYVWGILDGVHGAIQIGPEENRVECPSCKHQGLSANCVVCRGRGRVDSVPYADRPWDEVAPGLFLGGHFTARGPEDGSDCHVTDQFDLVYSMAFLGDEWGPSPNTEHVIYPDFRDADLEDHHHSNLERFADDISETLDDGGRVLVRCQAGINRSALVIGLVLVRYYGKDPDEVIAELREKRSPFVLFNESFTHYLRTSSA